MGSLCTSVIANHGRRSRRLFARQSMPCLNDDDDDDDDDDERFEPRWVEFDRLGERSPE